MSENEPGALLDDPMTSMEICLRVAFVQRLGSCAAPDQLAELAALEEGLPDPPCRLCPRRAVDETDELGRDVEAQPCGVPCMLPGEALLRTLRTVLMNGHKKTGN
jgi:hypothetical protein